MTSALKHTRRLVVKIGSSLLTNDGAGLDHAAIRGWAQQIAALKRSGRQVILVSSGAIAEGMQRLGWHTRPKNVHELQAAAAVGQMGLVQVYAECFKAFDLTCAQLLLTHDDLANRKRYLNARSTLRTLLELDVIPVINENDTVVTDEIRFGDNDTLSALVACLVDADALVILTDQKGLYTADPRKHPEAEFVHEARAGDARLEKMAGGAGSSIGSGGMLTKILAAKRAARSGVHTAIAWGREKDVLDRLMRGERIGTLLVAGGKSDAARKQWLAGNLKPRGQIHIDAGAVRALVRDGKSLLPAGVVRVEGQFERGQMVTCVGPDGSDIARGLAGYSAGEAARIAGRSTSEINAILGYVLEPELIHRDNLVLLQTDSPAA